MLILVSALFVLKERLFYLTISILSTFSFKDDIDISQINACYCYCDSELQNYLRAVRV